MGDPIGERKQYTVVVYEWAEGINPNDPAVKDWEELFGMESAQQTVVQHMNLDELPDWSLRAMIEKWNA